MNPGPLPHVTTVYGSWKYGVYADGKLAAVIWGEGDAAHQAYTTLARLGIIDYTARYQRGDTFPENSTEVIDYDKV